MGTPLAPYRGGETYPLEGLTGSPDRLAGALRGFKASSETTMGWVPERAFTLKAHTFTSRAYSRRLLSKENYNKYVCLKKETIYHSRNSKDIHRDECQAFTIAQLTNSSKMAGIRRCTMVLFLNARI